MIRREPAIAPGRQLGPDQHSNFIGNIQINRMGDLEVTAQQVDAERFSFCHHVAHELFGSRSMYRLWIKILIEGRDHKKRLPI